MSPTSHQQRETVIPRRRTPLETSGSDSILGDRLVCRKRDACRRVAELGPARRRELGFGPPVDPAAAGENAEVGVGLTRSSSLPAATS